MLESLISLFSIFIGVAASNITGLFLEKKWMTTSNSIAGVFGSIFLIKAFSRLGFAPQHIVGFQSINYLLFSIHILMSITGGSLMALLYYKLLKEKKKFEAL
ncbi:hypothetical protein [Halobacteriovorax sp. JY17]|uniref:hypothetical protein n=1 Tax=Halobacteriovorax sp. JY17 TaxID=2014617 RepID=UPI000C69FEA9|nr:hypothetical protein [Halobacteriovorax sp. JY17]PIK16425.1 MAG: hypothetical protein CES88_06705 [Halobacteriovorax sp. JY17]